MKYATLKDDKIVVYVPEFVYDITPQEELRRFFRLALFEDQVQIEPMPVEEAVRILKESLEELAGLTKRGEYKDFFAAGDLSSMKLTMFAQ